MVTGAKSTKAGGRADRVVVILVERVEVLFTAELLAEKVERARQAILKVGANDD